VQELIKSEKDKARYKIKRPVELNIHGVFYFIAETQYFDAFY